MSLYEYRESIEISAKAYQFYALVMAAMRQADSNNIEKLKEAFPSVHAELLARYHAPGGQLAND